jgi:outer membrane receptor protein involved in Fe transport
MSDLLRGTPGLSVQPGQNGRDMIRLRGTGGSGQCLPNVFLNGVYVPLDNGILEDIIRPEEVRAVEVYPGTASVPIEFQRPSGCGSIAIWTGPKKGIGR